jgi:glycosyltransferase involved in cell wall biosynthesis
LSKLIFGDLVSVVIPAYNHQQYIVEALNSVYDQSYQNIELILLDDCSKDSTLKVAQQWADEKKASERFTRVIIEKNAANLGAHNTINRGLSLAKGNALTILNSDDVYAKNRVETLMQAAEANQVDWLFSGIRVIGETGQRIFSELAIEIEAFVDYASCFPAVSFALLKKNIAATTGNLFFSRPLYNKVGEFRNLRYCHDWDFALQACLISEPIFINQPLYDYRIHGTNSFSALKVEQYLESQIVYRNYFTACRAGNFKNANAPWTTNYPIFFDKWVEDDEVLSGAFFLVGHDSPKYDRIAQSIYHSLK